MAVFITVFVVGKTVLTTLCGWDGCTYYCVGDWDGCILGRLFRRGLMIFSSLVHLLRKKIKVYNKRYDHLDCYFFHHI